MEYVKGDLGGADRQSNLSESAKECGKWLWMTVGGFGLVLGEVCGRVSKIILTS